MAKKVSTRELGLILGARLMKADDLHYGYWPDGLEVTMANMAAPPADRPPGCATCMALTGTDGKGRASQS